MSLSSSELDHFHLFGLAELRLIGVFHSSMASEEEQPGMRWRIDKPKNLLLKILMKEWVFLFSEDTMP